MLDLEQPPVGASGCSAIAANPGRFDQFVGEAPEARIESAKLAGVDPRAHLLEATRRVVRNLGKATLDFGLKCPKSIEKLSH